MLAVIILNFFLIHLAPGDPVETLVGEMGGATPQIIAQIRADYGLDKSPPRQLLAYISKMVRFDLGMSFNYDRPVTAVILERLPATLLLVITSLLLAIFLGTMLGVIAAQRPRGYVSPLVTIVSLAGFSAPVFWTGMMLLVLFSYLIPVFPSFGMREVIFGGTILDQALDILHHLALPAITLSSIYFALYSRLTRASMLDVLGSDYIRTARSKGLNEKVVVYKHALKNALLPVVTMAGLQFSQLIAGAVVVETVFSWPGMGQLAFESILRRDHPLLMGILFFSTLIVVVANILTDLSYRLLDPRIK
ncbi:MAG: ABC transporter permease [Deltaproteobacteria bacterium]|nr:ABC transporter permease [Deltaproteobacteria bacterium]